MFGRRDLAKEGDIPPPSLLFMPRNPPFYFFLWTSISSSVKWGEEMECLEDGGLWTYAELSRGKTRASRRGPCSAESVYSHVCIWALGNIWVGTELWACGRERWGLLWEGCGSTQWWFGRKGHTSLIRRILHVAAETGFPARDCSLSNSELSPKAVSTSQSQQLQTYNSAHRHMIAHNKLSHTHRTEPYPLNKQPATNSCICHMTGALAPIR